MEPTGSRPDRPGPPAESRAPLTMRIRRGLTRSFGLLVAGLAIRELFSFWTGHPYDFEVWIRTGSVVAGGTNPYLSFWGPVPGASFAFLNQTLPSAAYPPFWPGLAGILFRSWEWGGGGNRFVLYFLLKQPMILADVASAVLLGRLVERWTGDRPRAERARNFWLFFPYAIAISAIWGQIDSIVLALLLGALLVGDTLRRTVLEGVGVFVKWLPAVFLPLEFFRARGRRRLLAGLVLLVPLALTLAAFALGGWPLLGFQDTTTSQTHGGGGGMNLAQFFENPSVSAAILSVPGLFWVLSLLWVPVIVISGYVAARWTRRNGPAEELRAVLFVTVLFMAVRWGLYEQYMLYVFTLLLLDLVAFHPGRAPIFYGLVLAASAYLLVNNDLGIWFASPLWPSAFSYAVQIDQATTLGGLRADALVALAVIVTTTLLQLAYALLSDAPDPRPWFWPRTRPRAPATASAPPE